MKKKSLLIISTSFNYNDKRYHHKDFDILSLTINHHYYLKKNDINHLTIESFYDNYYQEKQSKTFIEKSKEWLLECDNIILRKKNLKSSFSGNGFWFLQRLVDLFYVQYCINKMSEDYETIELITDKDIVNIEKLNFNFKDMSFGNIFNSENYRLVNLIFYAFPTIKVLKVKGNDYSFFSSPCLNVNFSWLINGFIRKFLQYKVKFYLKLHKKKKLFWKLQEGYDLKTIEDNAKNFSFLNIKKEIINDLKIIDNKFSGELNVNIHNVSKSFFLEFLPSFEVLLTNLIQQYINHGLTKIDQIIQNINHKLVDKKPSGIILPMCAQDIFDFYIVSWANKVNIPVYFIKHNGPIEIFRSNDFLIEYLEQNKFLKRVQFIHSKLEKNNMKNIELADTKILKPIGTNIIEKKIINKKIKILYSFGSPSQYTLKDLRSITFDNEKINFLEKLILSLTNYDFVLHIKAHPRGQKELINLFTKISKNNTNIVKIKFIYNSKIESLFYNYDLIISDTLFSKVVSNALYTKKNIVAFCPRKECISEENYDLLSDRVKLIHNVSEIGFLFHRFQNNIFEYNINHKFMNNISGDMSFNDAISNVIEVLDNY